MSQVNDRLLFYIAEVGPVVADHVSYRHLWYQGFTKWVSPTKMALSDLGASRVNRILYENAEQEEQHDQSPILGKNS